MQFYLLNSGARRHLARECLRTTTQAALRPLVTRGGRLPVPLDDFVVETAHTRGGALFTLWYDHSPVVVSGLAWAENGATEIWSNLEETYFDVSDDFARLMGAHHLPSEPNSCPWLGVIILPSFYLLPQDCWSWIGDFACSFAWTLLLERTRSDAQPTLKPTTLL